MTRKRCRRRVIVPMPPRGLRPMLSRDQLTDLSLAHLVNLDDIAHGRADEGTLWQTVGGVLTWSRVADLTGQLQAEMAEQLQVVTSVVDRYRRTGRVGFSGSEYQQAKRGVELMDQLAASVDRVTAIVAAEWSEARTNQMQTEAAVLRRQSAGQRPETDPNPSGAQRV